MNLLLIAKPSIPEVKTWENRPFNYSHKSDFPIPGLAYPEKSLDSLPKLHPSKLQAKLKVSQPGDPYEQEADRVADTIMEMPEPKMRVKRNEDINCPTDLEEKKNKGIMQLKIDQFANREISIPDNLLSDLGPGKALDRGSRLLWSSGLDLISAMSVSTVMSVQPDQPRLLMLRLTPWKIM